MFGRVNVWRIAKLKVVYEKKFGEWIDFGHKDTIYKLKFGRLSLANQPLPSIPAIRYSIKFYDIRIVIYM